MITADEVQDAIDKRFRENVQTKLAKFEKDLETNLPCVTTTHSFVICFDRVYVGTIEAARILARKYRAAGWKVDLNEKNCSIEFRLKKKSKWSPVWSRLRSWCSSLYSFLVKKRYLRFSKANEELRRIEEQLDEELGISSTFTQVKKGR
jgi:hypothetical protein